MASHKTFGERGKILHSQAREIIANVLAFMKDEADNFSKTGSTNIPIANYKQRVLAATGISEKMYKTIVKESKDVNTGASTSFSTPRKKRPHKKTHELVESEEHAVRTIIHEFHITQKRSPTVAGVMNRMHEMEIPFSGSQSTLRLMLRELGFRWRKTEDNRKLLMESYDIRLKRITYLKQIQQYRLEGRPIVYTDESYIHTTHMPSYSWMDNSGKGLKKSVAKGRRLIMVHAGNENGFIQDALLLFSSGSKSGDYHDEMNWINFEKWAKTQLIPALPPRSVLVVDNASYHNTRAIFEPTTATRKADMISWLAVRNISHDPRLTKPELYNIIKQNKSSCRVYKLDTLLNEHGHSVLRLPPYHPELNPIEKVWAQVKHDVAVHNVDKQNMTTLINLTREAFERVTSDNWAAICNHVHKIEEEYRVKEPLLDDTLDEFIIRVNTGSSDEEEESDDEDNNECEATPLLESGIAPLDNL